MKRAVLGILAFSVLLAPAFAAVYDAAADFSASSNPSGVWSYGSRATLASPFTLGTASGNELGVDYWVNNWHFGAPSVTHNGTGAAITHSSVTWGPGDLAFHPGASGEYADIRFTVPDSGPYALESSFAGADFLGPTSTDVHILLNETLIFDGTVNAYGLGPSYSTTRSLTAGDTVDFVVGVGADGNYSNDNTRLVAQFSQVPEPSTLIVWSLVGALAVTLGWWRRRKA
jgi:hypothetical protein